MPWGAPPSMLLLFLANYPKTFDIIRYHDMTSFATTKNLVSLCRGMNNEGCGGYCMGYGIWEIWDMELNGGQR